MNPTMNSQQIQDFIATWANDNGFNAPYGVLTSEGKSPKGRKVLNVTFGRDESGRIRLRVMDDGVGLPETAGPEGRPSRHEGSGRAQRLS